MLNAIASDMDRYLNMTGRKYCLSFMKKIHILLFAYGLHAIMVYRFGSYLKSIHFKLFLLPVKALLFVVYYSLSFAVKKLYGIYISENAIIGKGLYIGHFGGIIINKCKIGKNCSLQQHVKIGVKPYQSMENLSISIGDNIWIGAHSIIENNIIIKDGATISAGSLLKQGAKIKERCLVMGNPARTILRNYDNSKLL